MSLLRRLMLVAYDSAYDLDVKPQYSGPHTYDAGGNLAARWYVYYSFRPHPGANLVRQDPIDTGVNIHKNKRDRQRALRRLAQAIEILLRDGYNPYTDDPIRIYEKADEDQSRAPEFKIEQAFDFVLNLKESQYGTAFADFKSRLLRFKAFLIEKGYADRSIREVNKPLVINYLNQVQIKTSPRNRNNTRIAISTFFSELLQVDAVAENFVAHINIVSAKPERNKSLSTELEDRIYQMLSLSKQGRLLRLYIYFVSYNFLRPIEVSRLLVKDVDTIDRVVQVRAKNKPVKRKRLPDILLEELPDLGSLDPNTYLFGRDGLGQYWQANETSRSGYYSTMFRMVVKENFNLDKDYGLYSFRHTFIARLYNALLLGTTPDEAESRLMLITGHSTRKALRSYLREIDAVLPDDYSPMIARKPAAESPQSGQVITHEDLQRIMRLFRFLMVVDLDKSDYIADPGNNLTLRQAIAENLGREGCTRIYVRIAKEKFSPWTAKMFEKRCAQFPYLAILEHSETTTKIGFSGGIAENG